MKKFIFPSIIAIYFVVVFIMTDLQFKKYDIDMILPGLGAVPTEIIYGLLIILGLGIVSVLTYIICSKKGGSEK